MTEKQLRQRFLDGDEIHCGKCGSVIGDWIAVPHTKSTVPNFEELIVEVLLPVGLAFDNRDGVYRLSKNARRRIEQGLPARRFRADQLPLPRGQITVDHRVLSNWLERSFRRPEFASRRYEGNVLDDDQRDDTIVDFRDTAPLPAKIECTDPTCKHVNEMTIDTAHSNR
jgi:hypothetical protein